MASAVVVAASGRALLDTEEPQIIGHRACHCHSSKQSLATFLCCFLLLLRGTADHERDEGEEAHIVTATTAQNLRSKKEHAHERGQGAPSWRHIELCQQKQMETILKTIKTDDFPARFLGGTPTNLVKRQIRSTV